MLFNYEHVQQDRTSSLTDRVIKWSNLHHITLLIVAVSALILLLQGVVAALIFASFSIAIAYIYRIWNGVSSLDFTVELDDFNLQDVINDLERH